MKLSIFSVCASTRSKNRAPYNIVLDIKRQFYTYKHLKGYDSD